MAAFTCFSVLLAILGFHVSVLSGQEEVGLPLWEVPTGDGDGRVILIDNGEYGPDDNKRDLEQLEEVEFESPLSDKREDVPSKRFFGRVLGNGFKFGKRSQELADADMLAMPEKRMYGFVLGRGFKFGKRGDEQEDAIENEKRFGWVLGRGFKFGKRNGDDGWFNDEDRQESGSALDGEWKRADDVWPTPVSADKRYGWLLGRGFGFGKRYHGNKRYGSLLGGGFKFGKRGSDSYGERIGFLLGRGMNFKKRDSADEGDEDMAMDKRFGYLLGRGLNFKRSKADKRFGYLLGRGLNFRKRSGSTDSESGEKDDYRFGDVQRMTDDSLEKRYFGNLLGGGFKFGKRKWGNGKDDKKRFGYIIGNGFKFGKREDATEEIEDDKRIGHVLGFGFKVGKRAAGDDKVASM